MEYIPVQRARAAGGLRLAVTAGVPGPWSESAKKIFEYKKLAYLPVAQHSNEPNDELQAWAGVRNAPVAVYGNDAPRTSWSDILKLAERLAPLPALLPEDPEESQAALALCQEICGEWGFGWCRRLLLIELTRTLAPVDDFTAGIQRGYGFEAGVAARAAERAAQVLHRLAQRLRGQRARGYSFLSGREFGVCDLYWACFSLMIRPIAHELAPMPQIVRQFYSTPHPAIERALDEALIDHRDDVFARYLATPLDF
jgi:glutathione S-transferase